MAYKVLKAVAINAPMKRIELSRTLEIKKPNITKTLAPLMADKLIMEETPGNIRSRLVMSNKHYALSFELSETKINYAQVFLNGDIGKVTTIALANNVVDCVISTIKEIVAKESTRSERFLGASIAIPGQIDSKNGKVIYSARLQWDNIELAENLLSETGVKFSIDNNTRCQLRKLNWYDNYTTRSSNTLFITIDEGVGCALYINGGILEGNNFMSGEIGHLTAGDESRACRCGKLDCLQTYCNISQLLADVKRILNNDQLSSIAEAYKDINSRTVVDNILNRSAKILASVLQASLSLLDPQKVILSCADKTTAKLLAKHMEMHLQNNYIGQHSTVPSITPSSANTPCTLMGAASLCFEEIFLARM